MSNHVFCNLYIDVALPIVNLKNESHEIRQNGRRPRLGFYGWHFLACSNSLDGEPDRGVRKVIVRWQRSAYGTMFGPIDPLAIDLQGPSTKESLYYTFPD